MNFRGRGGGGDIEGGEIKREGEIRREREGGRNIDCLSPIGTLI